MLTPESVHVPAPAFVSVPLPVVIVPLTVPFPAPCKVRFWFVPVIEFAAVLNVRLPASDWMIVAAASVTVPCHTFGPADVAQRAIVGDPGPGRSGFCPDRYSALYLQRRAGLTVTPPAVVPVAVAFWMFNTPTLTAVAPV